MARKHIASTATKSEVPIRLVGRERERQSIAEEIGPT
jgi:hypothetical protein